MRFGHCKTCWWWKEGFCYMHNNRTKEASYCPDHTNREKENRTYGTIDVWIEKNNGNTKIY